MGSSLDDVKELLKGRKFDSLAEVNAFLKGQMQECNQANVDDFLGLSPEQMHRLLHFPFETPELFVFPACLDVTPSAPIISLFNLLAAGIGEDGLKATTTGNLPRKFCRDTAMAYFGEEGYKDWSRYGELKTEPEFRELHVTRLVAELAGLVRTYKGKFILSKECHKLMAGKGVAAIFPRMFKAFVQKYNWAYQDRLGEVPFIQQSFLFTLYMLTLHGKEWHINTFYEDSFLRAFPILLSQIRPIGNCYTPEMVFRNSYSRRCLDHFAQFMGLAEIERPGNDRYSGEFMVKSLPLLDHLAQFHL